MLYVYIYIYIYIYMKTWKTRRATGIIVIITSYHIVSYHIIYINIYILLLLLLSLLSLLFLLSLLLFFMLCIYIYIYVYIYTYIYIVTWLGRPQGSLFLCAACIWVLHIDISLCIVMYCYEHITNCKYYEY